MDIDYILLMLGFLVKVCCRNWQYPLRQSSKCDLFKIHAVHLYEILTLPTIR